MKAVRFHEFGGPEVLRLEEVPDVTAGPGEELIEVTAIGANYGETVIRSGKGRELFPWYPGPELPAVLGSEVVGTTADGRRVIGVPKHGAYAELAVLADPVEIPAHIGDHEALALLLQGTTAVAAFDAARVQPGDRVLVEAAAGGVGSLLVQLAKRARATIIAASSKPVPQADEQPGYDWADVEPVDVVFESVGGEVGKRAFELVKDGVGRMVVFGCASGEQLDVTASDVFRKGVALIGLPRHAPLDRVFELDLKPLLGDVYPLAETAAAHRALEDRTTSGKVILVP